MDRTTTANSTNSAHASAKHDVKYSEARKKRMVEKLIKLYKENDCLWNVRTPKFFDVIEKREAWESIAKEMNTTSNSVKCCIYCLRCRLNFEMRHKRQHCREASNFFLAEQFKFLKLSTDKKKFVAAQQMTKSTLPIAKPQTVESKNETNCPTDDELLDDKVFYEHLFQLHEERRANNLAKMRKTCELQKNEPRTHKAPDCPKTPNYRKLENYFRETRSPLSKTVAELRRKANGENY